jgi:serine-type D-Ala-D-Ala endopeptidase (penicillin-binding protein 7)
MSHKLTKFLLSLFTTLVLAGFVTFLTGFVMVAPANVSVTPGLEGPPRPPVPELKHKAPRVYCEAAVLIDNSSNATLYAKHPYEVRPIASITKLLTVLTFLDQNVDWDKEVQMTRTEAYHSSQSRLRSGDIYKVRDVFNAALIASDNRAARLLARSTGLEQDSFVVLMNAKARELGLLTLSVEEVTGLSENNVASAVDCGRLLNIAASNPKIKAAMRMRTYDFVSSKYKRRYHLVNTNRLLRSRWHVEGGKTGYIFESGWCVTVRAKDWHGNDVTAVVLGARSQSSRFSQADKMFRWAFRELRG